VIIIALADSNRFLLARLFVDSLLDKRTISKVKSTLKAMKGAFQTPDRAYDQAYNEAIDRIKGQLSEDTALAMSVLAWIINAKRPLTVVELCHAVAIEPKQESLDPGDIHDINDLVSVCAGLVSVDEESEIVRLVHYTTQKYLERTQDLWNPGARLSIASTCLTYLSFSTFRNILDTCDTHLIKSSGYEFDDDSSEYPFDKHPFVKYAATYWVEHLLPFQAELREQACLFLRDDALTRHAREAESMALNKYWARNEKMNGLHIMAHRGMHVLFQDFMPGEGFTPTISIDSRDSWSHTPLSYAAASGHENVVKILLDNGADATCDSLMHALFSAARIGHESIVTLLLDRGVDIGDWGHTMSIALEKASYNGHERVVRILLRRGANIYMDHRNALSAAIEGGHENIVKLLVDPCTDLNMTGAAHRRTALHLASERGHNNIVRFLLEKGADVHCDFSRGTALHLAAYNGHESVVKTLLDWGADINAHCILDEDTALHSAIRGGHESVVKMLLDSGADVNAHCKHRGAAIMCASELRNDNITEMLLDAGADMNILGGEYGSLLNTLAYRGSTRVLRAMIERHHADPKLVDFHGRTALLMAVCAEDSDTFHYLLDLGLNPDAKDAKGDGILSYAALGDSEEVFKSVLEYSKGLERSGFWSPLHWACRKGNTYAVERLLEQGYRDELVTLPDSEETWDAVSIAIYHDQVGMLEDLSPSSASLLNVESGQRAHGRGVETTYVYCSSCSQVSPHIKFSILTSLDAHQGQKISLPYHRCRDCPAMDYCFMCKPLLGHLHPHHTWELKSGPKKF
jgi:ankyrin repeat protein